jgi:hypothetical protein
MKRTILSLLALASAAQVSAQQAASPSHPAVYSWLQNTTETGTYYVSGNSTAQSNGILVNCQEVEYSADFAYTHTEGVPAYTTGPFLDGNPSFATAQGDIYKIPLNPTPSNNPSNTTGGTIGVFINGVSLFDYRDGVAWNPNTNALCGGPGNPSCPGGPMASMDWNRDAIPAEMGGFDCSKAHPAMGNYHHHQNPSAFDLDQNVVSTICNLYDAEGLYAINASVHSPLLGFAYDGYPIYGAYGYANENGTGGIVRIKSGYEASTATTRASGPAVNATYFSGYFREDYTWVSHAGQEDYLDEHNGRNCVTPEYPGGTYAYFCTVDEDWNSVYPYAVGPTFYGTYADRNVASVTEPTTVFVDTNVGLTEAEEHKMEVVVFPNPASDLVAMQVKGLIRENMPITVLDITGKVIAQDVMTAGTTIWYLDTKTLYDGIYIIKLGNTIAKRITVARD